jgi:hypothetical protein
MISPLGNQAISKLLYLFLDIFGDQFLLDDFILSLTTIIFDDIPNFILISVNFLLQLLDEFGPENLNETIKVVTSSALFDEFKESLLGELT